MAALMYVDDSVPGIRRLRLGSGFQYRAPDGSRVSDRGELERIAKLAIPPAYSDVWICPSSDGHLQATGRDARDLDKFAHVAEFGRVLPLLRRRVTRDLAAARGVPTRTAVLAVLVRLLDTTLVRVGNEEYVRSNGSFGLTTLRNRHAAVRGSRVRLQFRGKSGVAHEVGLDDPMVARIVKRCQALPGQELFRCADDDGAAHSIDSGDVNEYLREISGADVTAKDFRTWHASVLALELLQRSPSPSATEMLCEVAASLRNTVAVCRKSYVHPRVLQACVASEAVEIDEGERRRGLSQPERRLLGFIDAAEGRA
jgi:DNA topoisomerase I